MITKEEYQNLIKAEAEKKYPNPMSVAYYNLREERQEARNKREAYIDLAMEKMWPMVDALQKIESLPHDKVGTTPQTCGGCIARAALENLRKHA